MDPLSNSSQEQERVVRELLGAWAKRDPRNPAPDFGGEISLVSIEDKTAYAGFLRCLFDVRTGPVDKLLPYLESKPPLIANKNDLWELPSGLVRQFLEQEATVLAAESGEPMDCNLCTGVVSAESCGSCHGAKTAPCGACAERGRKTCSLCQGRGSFACASCKGSGTIVQSMSAVGTGYAEVCPDCFGKKIRPCHECSDAAAPDCPVCSNTRVVACPACKGAGLALCAQCGGSRRVIAGFTVSVAYKLLYYRSLVRDPEIPEAVLPENPPSGRLGESILQCESDDVASFSSKIPEGVAGEAARKVLAQAVAGIQGKNSRVIFQSLSVERIPIFSVRYAFRGKDYRAWATRFQNRVVAIDDPFADMAALYVAEAEAFLDKRQFALFDERASKAESLAPRSPALASLRAKAGSVQAREITMFGAKAAGALALAIPTILAFLYSSPRRFAPLAALSLATMVCALASAFVLASRRLSLPASRWRLWSAGAAAAGAALCAALFVIVSPIRRIDEGDFAVRVSRHEELSFANWGTGDASALESLIDEYAKLGVDTSVGRSLLERYEIFLVAAREQAPVKPTSNQPLV
ncbi:MAG: hypothetical protein AAB036_11145, partial [Elusimicrobiota bacterium]